MRNCELCDKVTKNPKFCSISCAAIYNNKHRKYEYVKYYCKICNTVCGIGYKQASRKYCENCFRNHSKNFCDWSVVTILELKNRVGSLQAHARIRGQARQIYRAAKLPILCKVCGYSKYIEVCHIKPVSSFDSSTPIAIVNDINNLVGLCRNCHWEFDHGLINL